MTDASRKPAREFSTAEALAYMIGAIGIQLLSTMMLEWAAIYYHPPEGADKIRYTTMGLASLIMIIGILSDAISDPMVGYWSDRSRSRLGRRRPFIIYGSPLACVSFVLFWFPPLAHERWLNFAWGAFWAMAFFWGLTLVIIPYIALLPEMARSTGGRVKLGVYQAVGMILGLVLGFASGILITKIGVKATGALFGAVSFATFQFAGWTVKERFVQSADDAPGSLRQMGAQLAGTLKNRPFLIFLAAETIFTLGFTVIQIVLPDYNMVILGKEEDFVTLLFLPFLLVCFPLIFVIEPVVKKWNTRITYASGLFGFAILFPLLGLIGLVPDPGLRIVLLLIMVGLAGAPQAVKYVMPGPLIGEIADYDEKHMTGRRREAIYSGAIGFAMKTAMMLSYGVRYAVYAPFGEFSVRNHAPVLLIGPVTAVICMIGFFVFLKYPDMSKQE